MVRKTKITIKRINRPSSEDVNEELQWFCNSLGLFGSRDKDKSCFRLFIVLLRGLRRNREFTSDEIASHLNLSRGTVIHHMHKLMNSGLVVTEGNKYMLRVENLEELVGEIERDIRKTMHSIREVAEEIDQRLDL